VLGGIEMAVRYITRANERYQLRAKLYHVAMDLLATKNPSASEGTTVRSGEKSPAGVMPAGVTLESGTDKASMLGTPEIATKS
jgi:hypothetical protein